MIYICFMKKRKQLDLHEDCIKEITKEAIDKKTVFKLHAEKILENYANKLTSKK